MVSTSLTDFYKQQWEDLRQLNHLDWRILALFGSLISLVNLSNVVLPKLIQGLEGNIDFIFYVLASNLITTSFSIYGVWTVSKNQAIMLIRFWIISQVEKTWGMINFLPLKMRHNILNKDRQKKSYGSFLFFTSSRRRGLIFVYFILMIISFMGVISSSADITYIVYQKDITSIILDILKIGGSLNFLIIEGSFNLVHLLISFIHCVIFSLGIISYHYKEYNDNFQVPSRIDSTRAN